MKVFFFTLLISSLIINIYFFFGSSTESHASQLNHSATHSESSFFPRHNKQSPTSSIKPLPSESEKTFFHNHSEHTHKHGDSPVSQRFSKSDLPKLSLKEAHNDLELWMASLSSEFFKENPQADLYELYDQLTGALLYKVDSGAIQPEQLYQQFLTSDDPDLQNIMSMALAENIGSKEVQEKIIHSLTDGTQEEKDLALDVLAQKQNVDENLVNALTEQLEQPQSPDHLNQLVSSLPVDQRLSQQSEQKVVSNLLRVIKDQPGSMAHLQALEPLSFYAKNSKQLSPIFDGINHSNEKIRARSAFVLGNLADRFDFSPQDREQSKDLLWQRLNDPQENSHVKKMAADALSFYRISNEEQEELQRKKALISN